MREKKPFESHTESHTLHDGFLTNAHNIAGQVFLRPDPKYRFFWDFLKGDPLHVGDASVCLRDITVPCVKAFIPKGELNEPREIVELDLVEPRTSIYVMDSGDFETVEDRGTETEVRFMHVCLSELASLPWQDSSERTRTRFDWEQQIDSSSFERESCCLIIPEISTTHIFVSADIRLSLLGQEHASNVRARLISHTFPASVS